MSFGRRVPVAPPAYAPLPFGLWTAAQTPEDPDPHWQNGFTFQADVCQASGVTTDPCPSVDPAGLAKTPTSPGLPNRCTDPITVYSWIDCGPIGTWGDNGEMFEARARAALDRGEARAIESEFESGAGGIAPHLADATASTDSSDGFICQLETAATVVATGVGIARAIGELEGALAECYGGVGTIHMPYKMIAIGADKMQWEKRGPRLFTYSGTPVAAGAGYRGLSPLGAAPAAGTAWLYATGALIARRSAVRITSPHESLDKSKNDMVVIAERTYALGWDCCHFAALVTL